MTTLWFLVALTLNPDGTVFMRAMPELQPDMTTCMAQDYIQTETNKMFCVEADDFADLIHILLVNFNFGGQST